MKKLKNSVLLETPDIFDDEFDLSSSEGLDGMDVVHTKPQKIFSSSPCQLAYW